MKIESNPHRRVGGDWYRNQLCRSHNVSIFLPVDDDSSPRPCDPQTPLAIVAMHHSRNVPVVSRISPLQPFQVLIVRHVVNGVFVAQERRAVEFPSRAGHGTDGCGVGRGEHGSVLLEVGAGVVGWWARRC